MGTIADKLNKVLSTKEDIKAAIIEKGQTVADTDTFASYPDKIRAIETGGEMVRFLFYGDQSGSDYIYHVDHSATNVPTLVQTIVKKSDYKGGRWLSGVKVGDIIIVQTNYESQASNSECRDVFIEQIDSRTYIIVVTSVSPEVTLEAI